MSRYVRVVAIITLIIALLTIPTFASAQMNEVSPDEAAELALFYYCMNSLDNEMVNIDEYVVTPLYDGLGEVSYYAIDFFIVMKVKVMW